MSEVHSSFQKVFENEGKTKIEKCNHPTPEAYNSWQKVLKKEGRDEIKNVTILHLRSLYNSLQKVLRKEGGDKIESFILHLRSLIPCLKRR